MSHLRYVIAPFSQFNHSPTSLTPLPSFLPGNLQNGLQRGICRAITWVRRVLARDTSELLANRTCSGRDAGGDVTRANKGRTSRIRAVRAIPGLQLFPLGLEVARKLTRDRSLHKTPRHDLLATHRRVKSFIFQAQTYELLETIDAVDMLIRSLQDSLWRFLVVARCADEIAWRCVAVLLGSIVNLALLKEVGLLGKHGVEGR